MNRDEMSTYSHWLAIRNGESRFGVCPHCVRDDGFLNVGRSHWFFCREHKVKWLVGSNLFSGWRHETEEQQRSRYDEIGLGSFQEIAPISPARGRAERQTSPAASVRSEATRNAIQNGEDLPF